MRKRKARSLTLIEVVIALTLIGMILSLLWQAIFGLQRRSITEQKKSTSSVEKALFYTRLSQLFNCLDKDSAPLYTEKNSHSALPVFVVSAHHPIDTERAFSGLLKSSLTLEEGHITLTSYAKQGEETLKEHFFSHVKSLSISFFDPSLAQWKESWEKTSKNTPAIVRITYQRENKEEELFFFPSGEAAPILYPEDKIQ